jgi:hypothetical protein
MTLGEELVAAKLVTTEQVEAALARQREVGGTLGQALVALGAITEDRLEKHFRSAPPPLMSLADTGLRPAFLMTLALKTMHALGAETAAAIAQEIRLPPPIAASLLKLAQERALVEPVPGVGTTVATEIRHALSGRGKEWIAEAMDQSEYVGPAPVTLAAYQAQVDRQRITNDRIDRAAIAESLAHLVLDEATIDRLGPAVNSGRAILLYGAPGNGKTSIATGIARAFRQTIWVPHCIEVDGQVIKILDPSIHTEVPVAEPDDEAGGDSRSRLRRGGADRRWAQCRRPVSIVGGELTLDMLELGFNPHARVYEAPFHIKANGGIFVIDDFGRQIDRPEKILNRWTLPLESRTDYLTLHTGRKFGIRFDGLVVFSTNIPPSQIMDSAMMRRIPYNFPIDGPSEEDYARIFEHACASHGLAYDPAIVALLMAEVYGKGALVPARFHPRFIVEHVIARCRFQGRTPVLEPDLVREAAGHLAVRD